MIETPEYRDPPQYKCAECDKVFSYWQDLVDHLAKTHGWDPYQIDSYLHYLIDRYYYEGHR